MRSTRIDAPVPCHLPKWFNAEGVCEHPDHDYCECGALLEGEPDGVCCECSPTDLREGSLSAEEQEQHG